MSYQASTYARELCQREPRLGTTARLVLMLVAARANVQTHETYTGRWLVDAAGAHFVTVRRALAELVDVGAIAIEHRPGRSSVIRFPIAGRLSTPRALTRGVADYEHPRAVTGTCEVVVTSARSTHEAGDGCSCDLTGWIYDEATNTVSPCPDHHPRAVNR